MEKLLTVNDLSKYLQVSKRTIYDWTHVGFIPHYKFPKGLRFRGTEIDRWIKKRKIEGRNSYSLMI